MAYSFPDNIQRGIIYLLKNDRDFYHQINNLVKSDYFEFPSHQRIFEIVQAHFDKYGKLPNDDVILQQAKEQKGSKEHISDYEDELAYINNIDKTTVESTDYLLDIIEKFAKSQAMKDAIAQSIPLIKEDRMGQIYELVNNALLVSRDVDIGQEYFEDYGNRWDRVFNAEKVERFATPFDRFNKTLEGGPGRKELCMVVAAPGVGKSLFLVNQGVEAMKEGRKVLYVSLEMSEDKIAQRFDSVMTLVPQTKLKDPATQLQVTERLKMFKDKFGGELVIKEFPTGQASVSTIRNLLVQLRNYNDFEPDLLIVDYLELLRPVREIEQEHRAQQRIAEELRGICVEYDILCWTATQTNRQGRMVKIITDAELGDSYGKIRTCDFAFSLNQTKEEFDDSRMRTFIIKSRNGRPNLLTQIQVDYHTLVMKECEELVEAD